MSTRRKEGGPPGKEKRGTSPSSAGSGTGTAAGRKNAGPSKTSDSNPSGKSIPSYLKPTAASSSSTITDTSKLHSAAKKRSSVTTIDKATMERRRSFDKPPSSSRLTKSPVSPNPTFRSSSFSGKSINDTPSASVARRRSFDKPPSPSRSMRSPVSPSPAFRSSSFSGKTSGGLSKGMSERNSKGLKDGGKQQSLYARPASTVKKSSPVSTKKSEAGSGKKRVASSPEKVESPEVRNVPEPEPELDDKECFVGEEEETGYSLLEDEDVNNIIEEMEGRSHENDAVIESPTVAEHNEATIVVVMAPIDVEIQEHNNIEPVEDSTDLEHKDEEDKSRDEEISNQTEDVKEESTDKTNHTDDNDDSGAGDHDQDKETEDKDDENKEAVEVANGTEPNDQLEEKEVQEVVVEEKKEEEDATPKVAHGKKDLTLSNDVIEETRNKLTEQRRNRVKALAGAFETVISLQDK